MKPGRNGLAANVKIVEPLGPHLLVTCDVDGQLFRAILDTDSTVQPQDTLNLDPLPDRVRWFHPETNMTVS